MPRIRCLYVDCTFLDAGYCSSPTVELDPDLGCATYVPVGDEDVLADDDWTEDDDDDYEGWDTEDLDMDDDEDFGEDEEDDW